MLRKQRNSLLTVGGLRMKFTPRARVGQGLLSIAPWVNIVLLAAFFMLLNSKFILQPGVTVQLPAGPFRDGAVPEMVAVVLSVPGSERGGREELVFFDDERFLVKNPEQVRQLKRALDAKRRERPDACLVIQSDARVAHGTVMSLVEMAREVGIGRINLAEQPL